jgi:L-seryl-tRNA(Ser) seleniumtransferase
MKMDEKRSLQLRKIPRIDDVLLLLKTEGCLERTSRDMVVDACRAVADEIRRDIMKGEYDAEVPSAGQMAARVREKIEKVHRPSLRRVVNATGIILHTNLGRAPLCEEALKHVLEVSRGYSNLEYDIGKGKRGIRYDHVKEILCGLTGAEDALAVNNNAAAVLLVLNTLAEGKEVIVSRGELIEIGGEFRIPEVMKRSGAVLREVGTTNRTHLWDYEEAISERTGLILKVHTSNFRIVGFTEEADLASLVKLGRDRNIPLMNDMGSGCLVELDRYGLSREPTVMDSLAAGADVVTFSGDKLLGGPQAGIILGKENLLKMIKKNPLNRALRIDKMTLAALEGTLKQYLTEAGALSAIRSLRALTEPLTQVEKRAKKLLSLLRKSVPEGFSLSLKKGYSMAGGGSLPAQEVPTVLIRIRSEFMSANEIEKRLRNADVPIVARIAEDEVLFDLRTLEEGDFPDILKGVAAIAGP